MHAYIVPTGIVDPEGIISLVKDALNGSKPLTIFELRSGIGPPFRI